MSFASQNSCSAQDDRVVKFAGRAAELRSWTGQAPSLHLLLQWPGIAWNNFMELSRVVYTPHASGTPTKIQAIKTALVGDFFAVAAMFLLLSLPIFFCYGADH
jgi:hypothetical protein